jgi:uncharacterized protein YjbI with pentapeptide repeats
VFNRNRNSKTSLPVGERVNAYMPEFLRNEPMLVAIHSFDHQPANYIAFNNVSPSLSATYRDPAEPQWWKLESKQTRFGQVIGGYGFYIGTEYAIPVMDSQIANGVTLHAIVRSNGASSAPNTPVFMEPAGGQSSYYPYIDNLIYMNCFTSTRWVNAVAFPASIVNTEPHLLSVTAAYGRQRCYLNGILVASGSVNANPAMNNSPCVGYGNYIYTLYMLAREQTPIDVALFYMYLNRSMGQKKPYLFSAGTSQVALSGEAAGQSVVAATPSIQVPIAGAAAAIASASGSMSTQVPIVGAMSAVATLAATPSIQVPLSGAAQAVAAASGTMNVQVSFSGAALAQALLTGSASINALLSGAAQAVATTSGSISTSTGISGAAQAVATASGSIGVKVDLSGAAIAQALAAATPTVTAPGSLLGAAAAQATLSGAPLVTVPLTGNAQAFATILGQPTVIIPVVGASASVANLSGNVGIKVNLSGAALAQALASGTLTQAGSSLSGLAQSISSMVGDIKLNIPLSAAALSSASLRGVLSGSHRGYLFINRRYRVTVPARKLRVYM